MTQIKLKRVYEAPETGDGYRVLVDRMWPRGIRKDELPYDLWAKDIAPSPALRGWFHEDQEHRWNEFSRRYLEELEHSPATRAFIGKIRGQETVTLLFASKDTAHNQAVLLQGYLEKALQK